MKITDEAVEVFTQYRRSQVAELRPWQPGDDMSGVSVSAEDAKAGSPKSGDMIARNPKNHADQWLVAAAYFADNFEPISALPHLSQGAVRAPKGWVLVPREPTDQMLDAGSDAADGHFDIDADNGPWLRSSGFYSSYAAMLAFAPPSPVGVADDPIETSLKALGVTRTKATASKKAARRYIEKLEGRSPTDTQEGLSEASEVVAWLCEDQVMPDNHSVTLDGALAAYREKYGESYKITPLVRQSALTACQQEVERLRKALEEIASDDEYGDYEGTVEFARAALGGQSNG